MVIEVNSAFDQSSNGSIRPVFVFGVSGATWTILQPLISSGTLPNFARLQREGTTGVLSSAKANGDKHFRPQTAWPSISTGFLPDHHGITKFYHTALNLRVPPIWDDFVRLGGSAGLFGWPMTWPPLPTNGFVIPCHHARNSETWPPELAAIKELDRQQQSAVRGERQPRLTSFARSMRLLMTQFPVARSWPALAKAALTLMVTKDIEKRSLLLRRAKFYLASGLFLSLYQKYRPTIALCATFYVDILQHRFWRYYEPASFFDGMDRPEFRDAITRSYGDVDFMLGEVLKRLPQDVVVAVVSEHGMSAEPNSSEVGQHAYGIRGIEVKELARLGQDITPIPIARWIAFRRQSGRFLEEEVVQRLHEITVVETGLPLFNVHRNGDDEVIIKFNLSEKVTAYNQGDLAQLRIRSRQVEVPFLQVARQMSPRRSAMHDGQAVLMLHGKHIRRDHWLEGASIVDVTPTLLRAAGIKTDREYDGRVLDVFC